MRYARGSKSWGECARSGRKMKLVNMVVDGQTGLMVDPAWYEAKFPQDIPLTHITDAQALYRPAPELSIPDGEGIAAPPLTFP